MAKRLPTLDRARELGRQHRPGSGAIVEAVLRGAAVATAEQAVRRMLSAVGTQLQCRMVPLEANLPHDRHTAAPASRPSGVRQELVAFDRDRGLILHALDGRIADVRPRIRHAVQTLALEAAAPRADDRLAMEDV